MLDWLTQAQLLTLGNLPPDDISQAEAVRPGCTAANISAASQYGAAACRERYAFLASGIDVSVDIITQKHVAAIASWWIRSNVLGLSPANPGAQTFQAQHEEAVLYFTKVKEGHLTPEIVPIGSASPIDTSADNDATQVTLSTHSNRYTNYYGGFRACGGSWRGSW